MAARPRTKSSRRCSIIPQSAPTRPSAPRRKTTSRATSRPAGARFCTLAGSTTPHSQERAPQRPWPPRFPAPNSKDQLEIIFRPDPNIYDGRWSNVGWLQELPKPVTNLSWDNAAIMSGATLEKLGLEEDDIVEISAGGGKVKAPVIVAPGHPDNSVTRLPRLRPRVRRPRRFGRRLQRLPGSHHLRLPSTRLAPSRRLTASGASPSPRATTRIIAARASADDGNQNNSLEAVEALGPRGIIRYATLEDFKANPNFAHEGEGRDTPEYDTSLFPNWQYNGNKWGMSIDMNSCVGCNACIVGLLCREQHRRRRQTAGAHRSQHAVAAASTPTSKAISLHPAPTSSP